MFIFLLLSLWKMPSVGFLIDSYRFVEFQMCTTMCGWYIFFQVGDDATRKTKQCKHRAVSQSELAVVLLPLLQICSFSLPKTFCAYDSLKILKCARISWCAQTGLHLHVESWFSFHTFHTVSAPTQINKYMLCGKLGHLSFAFWGVDLCVISK